MDREDKVWKAVREVRDVCLEVDTANTELELVRADLVSAPQTVDCEELKVWRFGTPGSRDWDIFLLRGDRNLAV